MAGMKEHDDNEAAHHALGLRPYLRLYLLSMLSR